MNTKWVTSTSIILGTFLLENDGVCAQEKVFEITTDNPVLSLLVRGDKAALWSTGLGANVYSRNTDGKTRKHAAMMGHWICDCEQKDLIASANGEIWSLRTNEVVAKVDVKYGPVALSPNGKLFAGRVGDEDKVTGVGIFGGEKFTEKRVVRFAVPVFLQLSDKGHLGVANLDGEIAVWGEGGKRLFFRRDLGPLAGCVFFFDDNVILALRQDRSVARIDYSKADAKLLELREEVVGLAIDAAGKRACLCDQAGNVELVDSNAKVLATRKIDKRDLKLVNCCAYSSSFQVFGIGCGSLPADGGGKILLLKISE